jgi:uncharacterized protein YqcC (DUF446 family)
MKPFSRSLAARHADALRLADLLEAELRRLGAWRATPPPPEVMRFERAFGGDTMPFEHWIQLVLVPRLRAIAESGNEFPPSSELAAYAVREFDGREEETRALLGLLADVDSLSTTTLPAPAGYPFARPLRVRALYVLIVMAWAATALGLASLIAGRIAERDPDRILITAHVSAPTSGPWRGLGATIWGYGKGGSLQGSTAELTLPGRRPLHATIAAGADGHPPADAIISTTWSAATLDSWAAGRNTSSSPSEALAGAAAAKVGGKLAALLDALRAGTTVDAASRALRDVAADLGAAPAFADPTVNRYPPSAGTGLFVGTFSALFLPPMLVWMAWIYRQNVGRRRGH